MSKQKREIRVGGPRWGGLGTHPRDKNLKKIRLGTFKVGFLPIDDKAPEVTKAENVTKNKTNNRGNKSMGAVKYVTGKCELCGEEKKISNNKGMMTCSTCCFIVSSASNKPELVIKAMRHYHGDKFFPAAVNAESSQLAYEIESLKSTIALLKDENSALNGDLCAEMEKTGELIADKQSLKTEIVRMEEDNEHLKNQLRDIADHQEKPEAKAVDSLLLDLLMESRMNDNFGAIADKVGALRENI